MHLLSCRNLANNPRRVLLAAVRAVPITMIQSAMFDSQTALSFFEQLKKTSHTSQTQCACAAMHQSQVDLLLRLSESEVNVCSANIPLLGETTAEAPLHERQTFIRLTERHKNYTSKAVKQHLQVFYWKVQSWHLHELVYFKDQICHYQIKYSSNVIDSKQLPQPQVALHTSCSVFLGFFFFFSSCCGCKAKFNFPCLRTIQI